MRQFLVSQAVDSSILAAETNQARLKQKEQGAVTNTMREFLFINGQQKGLVKWSAQGIVGFVIVTGRSMGIAGHGTAAVLETHIRILALALL